MKEQFFSDGSMDHGQQTVDLYIGNVDKPLVLQSEPLSSKKNKRTNHRRLGILGTAAMFVAASCGVKVSGPVTPTPFKTISPESPSVTETTPFPAAEPLDISLTDGVDYWDFYSEALTPDPFLEPGRDIAVGGDQGDAGDTSAIVREIGSPFLPREDIRITNGRHGRGGAAVDLALLERIECNKGVIVGDGPLKDWTVVASESGELTVVGGEKIIVDGKEITDPNRSVVIVKSDKGKIGYMHIQPLDALKRRVKNGDRSIEEGEPIGKVTCEYPPGGNSTGFHVHLFTIDSEGTAEPFGADIEGWTFGIDPQNGETIATKGDEVRYVCGGICNSGPRKNVLPIGDPNASDPKPREPGIEEPDRTKAPEKVDPKTRIDAILAVEPEDSVEMIGRKHFLSQWLNALNLKRDAIDDNGNPTGKSLYISVTNLDSWLPNIRRLLNVERITNDPLKIAFIATDTMNGWDRLEGKGEIDDVSLDVSQWTEDDFTELEKKNGATPYTQYIGKLRFYERRQALYYSDYSSAETIDERPTIAEGLPSMSDWSKIVVVFDSRLYQDGIWENGPISVNDSYSVQGRWGDIRRVSDIYNIIYAHQFCYPEGEVGPGDKRYTGCVEIDS